MFDSFHIDSQKVMNTVPVRAKEPERRMVHISGMIGEFNQFQNMAETQKRLYWLNIIQERRLLIQQSPHNEWSVYELCKAVNELAEIDQVDFNGSSIGEKIVFIRQLVPCVTSSALRYGVEEYHDSRAFPGWATDYTEDDSTRVIEGQL